MKLALTLACALVFAASVGAQVRVQTLDRGTLEGRLTAWTSAGLSFEQRGAQDTVPWAALVSATFARTLSPARSKDVALVFSNGDRLIGRVDGGSFDEVQLATLCLGELAVLLDAVSAVEHLDLQARLGRPVDPLSGEEDALVLFDGRKADRLAGELVRLSREGPMFTSAAGADRVFDWGRVLAVQLAGPDEVSAPKGELAQFDLIDGSRFVGVILEFGERPLVQLAIGPKVRLPLEAVRRIARQAESFQYLSDLAPAAVRIQPWVEGSDLSGWAKDRALRGSGPAAIGERRFERSISARARTELDFDLAGSARSFRAEIGAAQLAGTQSQPGSMRIRLLVDGKERFASELLVAGAPAVPLQLQDLQGAKRLTVIFDFGASGPIGAVGVLGDPILRRD